MSFVALKVDLFIIFSERVRARIHIRVIRRLTVDQNMRNISFVIVSFCDKKTRVHNEIDDRLNLQRTGHCVNVVIKKNELCAYKMCCCSSCLL